MKKILLFILLSTVYNATAQLTISKDFSYSVSDPYQVVDGTKYYFSKGDEILTVKYGKGVFTFQKFGGSNMNQVKRVEVDKTTGFTIESFEEVNGNFYFFYSVWDKDAAAEQLYVRRIDFDACRFADEGERLIKVSGKVTGGFNAGGIFGFGPMYGGGKFYITKSYDESKILVQYRKYPESRNNNVNKDVIGMHVYDSGLNKIWSGDVKMPYTEKKMSNLDYAVDSEGSAYVLSNIYKDDSGKKYTKSGEPNYNMELIKIDAVDQEISHTVVKLKDKFTGASSFFEGRDGELIIAGFYSNDKKGGIDGFYLSKVQGDDVTDIHYYEVPVDVMKMYLSNRAQAKMEKKDAKQDLKMVNMILRDVAYDSDGGLTIYGEKHYVVEHYNAKTGTSTYTYYYQEIIGAAIGPDGELKWMKKFPKNQSGKRGRGGMGYHLITTGTTDYLLFLDNVKNIELPLNQFPKAHKDGAGGFLTGFKVDRESGETEKISLFDTKDAKGVALYQFSTERIIEINEKTFSVECYKKQKEDVMVTIRLD